MKKLAILTAFLFAAIGMNAQNNTGRTTRERTTTVTETKKETKAATRKTTPKTEPAATSKPDRTNNSKAVRPERSTTPAGNNPKVARPPRNTTNSGTTATPAPATRENREAGPGRGNSAPANREVRHPDNTNRSTAPSNTNRTRENRAVEPGRTNSYNRSPRSTGEHTTVNTNSRTTYDPKRGTTYTEQRKVYVTPAPRRVVRPAPHITYVQRPVEYRRVHNPYRVPPTVNIIWNEPMYHEYVVLYPNYHLWYYPFGYTIHTISSYDAAGYVGEIARVYGMVEDTWYSPETDEFYLYFGGPYPYNDFSVVLEGRDARRFSRRPERFFTHKYISVTGLVSLWDNKPEIDVKKRSQIDIY